MKTIAEARKTGFVRTLLGRRRNLPYIRSSSDILRAHGERAAINSPIQGSAADIATAAMLAIKRNDGLRELKWKMLLQVHDEVILEGPRDCVEDAERLVVECMAGPFPRRDGPGFSNPLNVDLTVNAKHADSWYDAK